MTSPGIFRMPARQAFLRGNCRISRQSNRFLRPIRAASLMRIYAVLLLFLVALSGHVLPASGEPATVVISRQDCRELLRHVPDADVSYKPGVDVDGKAVVPADLAPADPGAPDRIIIDLKRPLGQLQPNAPASVAQSDVYVGQLNIDVASGRVELNGQPLDGGTESDVLAACRKAG